MNTNNPSAVKISLAINDLTFGQLRTLVEAGENMRVSDDAAVHITEDYIEIIVDGTTPASPLQSDATRTQHHNYHDAPKKDARDSAASVVLNGLIEELLNRRS
ncbi:hypothetical protein EML15_02465 [Corynebacterium sp. sy017]|uniref:hypothetical protein n=1 Tax=unclassified Corynebacterium TaxID=2624378 RepID=UPI00118540B8|nr:MULTISPECIES: hypothetical protein [unclassified Corynebacterium]MBP3088021.1 hypothetical protein [Corynebacterium sp. sy017]QDZ42978.1 hypothetical protein FQV43_07230 [Corynebacterium sp. sy039]TSD92551.1 hypothetical protein ELY17_02465 [Corynebacterium sp. SY003]